MKNKKYDMMHFRKQKIVSILWGTLLIVSATSCSSGEESPLDDNESMTVSEIKGTVQKGPFVKGSQITIFALNSQLEPTGDSYPSSINDDLGNFNVNKTITAPYIELRATGYYYDETRRKLSDSPLSLQAICATKGYKVNINLLTTLTYSRIKYLVGTGIKFDNAVKQAEKELLSQLSMGNAINKTFTDLSISGETEGDGILLALSCLMQNNRSIVELTSLIADAAQDLEKDGTFEQKTKDKVHQYETSINRGDIIGGLQQFYSEKDIKDYKIPPFYKFVDTDGDGKLDEEDTIFEILNPQSSSMNGYPATGLSEIQSILSTEGLEVSSDCEWIEIEKKTTSVESVYQVDYKILANEGSKRTGHIIYKSSKGKTLFASTILQQSAFQRIYVKFNNGIITTKAALPNNNMINVNGTPMELMLDEESGKYYVELKPTANSTYSISYPNGKVEMGQDVYCCKVTFPPIAGESISPIYYAALKPLTGLQTELPNPVEAEMINCVSLVRIVLSGDESKLSKVSDVSLSSEDGVFLSGTASYLVYKDMSMFDPTYKIPQPIYSNQSNKVTIFQPTSINTYEVLMYPQQINQLYIEITIEGMKYKVKMPNTLTFEMGHLWTLNIKFNDANSTMHVSSISNSSNDDSSRKL